MACEFFDDRIPIEAFDDTLAAVDALESLDKRKLCHWCVLMFGDCERNEFLNSVVRFGEAAKSIRGLRFEVTGPPGGRNVSARREAEVGTL